MTRAALTLLVLAATVAASSAQRQPSPGSDLSLEALLVVGKASGACGILDLQLEFQQNTKMPGGDEFVVRFWTTEAARLGMTLAEYATTHCKTSLSTYERLLELAGQVK